MTTGALIKSAANAARADELCPGLLDALREPDRVRGKLFWDDLDEQLEDLVFPRWQSPAPSTAQRAAGVYFDVEAVLRFLRFCALLRHIKGRRFARRPFIPDLWQVLEVVGPVLGWKRPDGLRLYRELYLEVPRKNGKSTLIAALGLFLLVADDEPGAEVYSVAKDRDQARAVWAVGALMARAAPALRRRLRIPPNPAERGDKISFNATNSVWTVLGKDSRGNKHHGLNIHGALIDELHTINDPEVIGVIETGTGSRDQPLTVIITTAGIESESPLWADKRDFAVKVSERAIVAPESYVIVFAADPKVAATGDRWLDPKVHRGANPGYGRSLRPEYLSSMAAKAKANPVDRNRFLRLHLGIPTESTIGYIELPIFDRSAGLVLPDELEGQECYGGLDLADSRDLCAFALVFPDGRGALDALFKVWTPAATLHLRAVRDRADYVRWEAEGWLTTTPGETIDFDIVEAELGRLKALYDIRGVNYDRWGSKQLRDHLESAGLPIWEMGQGYASMSAPMKDLARIITEKRLRHGGNPVLRFACAGFRALEDPAGNVKPDKKRSTSRIDPMVALVMALDAYVRNPKGRSVYEERGLEVVGQGGAA